MVAPTDAPVLILEETEVGKELVARAFHAYSGRRERALGRSTALQFLGSCSKANSLGT
jgi:transcriptional regulator of aromatic amino acid metabolism